MTTDKQNRSENDATATGPKRPDALEGELDFYSDQGTRGGYWAFWDKRFISPNTTRFVCRKCYLYWDKEQEPDGPSGGTRLYHVNEGDSLTEAESRLEAAVACPAGQHDFELASKENRSYEGLHILANGDKLTIYEKERPASVVWSGTIRLRPYPRYTEKVFDCWIHADQEGIPRETWARWFFDENPARLAPTPKEVGRT